MGAGSVRTNEMDRESARAEERSISPATYEKPSGNGVCLTTVGAWGRWMAPRGL